ncbi:hypothetical protein P8960_01985 [Enterococcus lactis]|uniref:hypothetical protein n=1 Tax=Enterococcus TaxID=1350 RepID=UPI0024150E21|nr:MULTISPECIES: hypothetical protein [Enterococcus]MDV4764450.1 hypothetical protein [Enterococcus faecium]MDG4615698.1 hypothetical protein [Enterococcus lactis]MEB4749110.1 hypothetical protein [Enterococcus sp. E5-162]NTQ96503.1 hypothetical protein [Enterococcus faecium]HAQ5734373.1 hypothetical protein [Enterococcus faecium]
MKKKVHWGVVGATLIVAGGMAVFTINEQNYSRQVEAVTSELSTHKKQLLRIETEMAGLYADEHKQFLSSDVTQAKIDSLKKTIEKYKSEAESHAKKVETLRKQDQETCQKELADITKLDEKINEVQMIFDQTQVVNSLFSTPYIENAEINEEAIIIDDLNSEMIEEQKEKIELENLEENEFTSIVTQAMEAAGNQLSQIERARKVVEELYKDDKPTDKVTRETLESAKKEVELIKNEKAKKSFNEPLKAIEEKITTDEKAEAERVAAEEAKRQEEQAVANQAMQQTEVPETQSEATDSVASPTTPNTPVQNVTENITVQPTTPVAPPANPGSGSNTGGATSTPGGNTSGGSTGGNSSGSTPAPTPEPPYALNPYRGSGTFYASHGAATAAGRAEAANPSSTFNGYKIYTEVWSDGTEKYYLEFY